jgi:hypothetical protein
VNRIILVLATCLALAACGNKKDERPPAPSRAPAPVPVATPSTPPTEPAGSGSAAASDVPTEIDFEAQARTDIDEKNVDQRVKAIEQELGH